MPTVMAMSDSFNLVHDHVLTATADGSNGNFGVLHNDSADTFDPLSVAAVNGVPAAVGQTIALPSGASLTMQADGSFVLSPAANSAYTESFDYTATDGASSADAAVTIYVTNLAPSIMGQSFSVSHDQVLLDINLLANASDFDGDNLQAVIISQPAHGTLTTTTYTPDPGWTGTDSATVAASDGIADSWPATFTFQVTNADPLAVDDEFSTVHDQALTVDAWESVLADDTDADGDALTATIVQGSPYVTLASDGSFVCTPPAGWAGDITFSYTASDGISQSQTATVTIHFTDDAPIASDYEFTLHAGELLSLDATDGLLHDGYDANSDHITAEAVGAGTLHGVTELHADGSFAYEADPGYVGDDSFSYRLFDGVTYSQTKIVTIHVQDGAPVASPTAFDIWLASESGANVLATVSDGDDDTLTASLLTGPMYDPSFQLNPDGSFSYTRNVTGPIGDNFFDSFSYRAFDGTSNSASITVSLHLTDAPLAKDHSYILDSSGQLTVSAADGLLANTFNPMNAQVTAEITQAADPGVGTIDVNPDGSFVFTEGPDLQGEADFSYRLVEAGVGALFPITNLRFIVNNVISASVGLYSVNFDGNATIARDNGLGNYTGPQWLAVEDGDSGARLYPGHEDPISFTRHTKIGLIPTFAITPASRVFWRTLGDYLLVRADSDSPSATGQPLRLGYNQNVHLHLNAANDLTTQGFVLMDDLLLDNTEYGYLDLTWHISPNNGLTWISPTLVYERSVRPQGNFSSNQTFVTLASPNSWSPAVSALSIGGLTQLTGWGALLASGSPGFLSLQKPTVLLTDFYAGTEGFNRGNGAISDQTLVAEVWDGFQTRHITHADGTPLTFWENWNGPAGFEANDLLATDDGRCGAWAEFFVDVLRAWGGNFSNPTNVKQIRVDQQNTPVEATGFLVGVGRWSFGTSNVMFQGMGNRAGYGWSNELGRPPWTNNAPAGDPPNWQFNWQGQPAVTYLGGAAQNNANPFAMFRDHAVVRIGNILYDPSYGVPYQSTVANPTDDNILQAFQSTALAGYYWVPPVQGNLGPPVWYFRPATVADAPTVKLRFNDWPGVQV